MSAPKWTPRSLPKLPRIEYTSEQAANREEAARDDLAFGIRTLDDLVADAARRSHQPLPSPPRPTRKSIAKK